MFQANECLLWNLIYKDSVRVIVFASVFVWIHVELRQRQLHKTEQQNLNGTFVHFICLHPFSLIIMH